MVAVGIDLGVGSAGVPGSPVAVGCAGCVPGSAGAGVEADAGCVPVGAGGVGWTIAPGGSSSFPSPLETNFHLLIWGSNSYSNPYLSIKYLLLL